MKQCKILCFWTKNNTFHINWYSHLEKKTYHVTYNKEGIIFGSPNYSKADLIKLQEAFDNWFCKNIENSLGDCKHCKHRYKCLFTIEYGER